MRLGFIGLGAMGQPMALRLLRAGHSLSVWARRPERLEALIEAGAEASRNPAEVAANAELVFTMATADADVAAIAFGPGGLVHGFAPGGIHVDMSTISVRTTRALAQRWTEKGIAMLDAPVSGGVVAANSGKLAIMVGGETRALIRARPLFEILGATIVHVGGTGAGQVAKACNQMVMVAAIEACAEAIRLATASGLAAERVLGAVMGGAGGSRVLEVFGARMAARDFAAGVEARLHHKDFGILMNEAQRLACPLPVAGQVAQQLNALMALGWGGEDSAALLRVLEAAHA
ncbi:2-hydroxy-3-oxopropionate reductase [mine drainage metagenome]|uniref:2-hydroxy-3-oxopropionate reductase n=1 Tax=mine drainage metagenome TaxID=410659 RepID=A0A1J5RZU2_9ZZZZ